MEAALLSAEGLRAHPIPLRYQIYWECLSLPQNATCSVCLGARNGLLEVVLALLVVEHHAALPSALPLSNCTANELSLSACSATHSMVLLVVAVRILSDDQASLISRAFIPMRTKQRTFDGTHNVLVHGRRYRQTHT